MHLLTLTAFALLSSSLALAGKQYARDEWQVSADSLACLYMTSDVNWSGEGQNLCEVNGQCGNALPDGLTKNVSSAGPPDGITCFLYDAESCGGTVSAPIVYPGYANLSDSVINFDNRAMSWRCWKYNGWISSSTTSATTSVPTSSNAPTSVFITATLPATTSTSVSNSRVTITNTVGGVAVTSTSTLKPPSPASPVSDATVLTHTFADGSTQLTTTIIAAPT